MKLKKSSIVVKIIIAVLAVQAVLSIVSIRSKVDTAEHDREVLASEVKKLEAANAAIDHEIQNSENEDTIENIARDKLGLVLPGEVVYYDISE